MESWAQECRISIELGLDIARAEQLLNYHNDVTAHIVSHVYELLSRGQELVEVSV
jgi:hypothetical protein